MGVGQALVLVRYLPVFVAGAWLGASFFGWFGGWAVFFVVSAVLTPLGPGMDQQAEPEATLGVVWATFATFQGATLALVVLALGRRSQLPLAALWVLAGVVSGALAVAASSYLADVPALDPSGGGGSLGQSCP